MLYILALLLLCLLSACAAAQLATPPSMPISPTALHIEAPAKIDAGEPLFVTIHITPADAMSTLLLTAQGTFGFLPQQAPVIAGQAQFIFAPRYIQRAGIVQLQVAAGPIHATATVEIRPGHAVDPIVPLVGPRSIVADGDHWTMVVTTPRDQWDNPVTDGTTVTFLAQHPVPQLETAARDLETGDLETRSLETISTPTRNLLGWARIYSRTTAGRLLISARAEEGHSPERVVIEVPGAPMTFALHVNPQTAPADGQQWIQIRSEQIVDRYGNVLLDGTQATLLTAMPPDEISTIPAQTVDGRLYAALQAPARPGTMFVRAWIGVVSSQITRIDFTPGPAVQAIPIAIDWQEDSVVVSAGPLLSDREQFVPDGTAITFTLFGANTMTLDGTAAPVEQVTLPAEYGYATLTLRTLTLTPGVYAVAVEAGTGMGNSSFTIPHTSSKDMHDRATSPEQVGP